MSAPIVLHVGDVVIELRPAGTGLWVARRTEPGRWRHWPFTCRADAEAVCVQWALAALGEIQ